jgi:hypothetical protein
MAKACLKGPKFKVWASSSSQEAQKMSPFPKRDILLLSYCLQHGLQDAKYPQSSTVGCLFFWSSCTCFPALRAAKQLNKVLFHSRTMFYFAAQLSELKTSRH